SGHTWLNETTLELSFASQAAPGLYQLTLGPDVRDLYGLALDQDADHVPGESPDDQYHATFGIAQPPRVLQSRPAGTVGGPVTAVQFDFSVAMDPQSFAWNDDLVSFTGPAGTPAVTDFRWLDGDTLELSFAQQITPGLYQLVLGPSILSTGGIPLDQDGDLIAGETPDDRYAANFEILAGPRVLSHQPSGDQMQPVSAVTLTFSEAISAATFTAADVRLESPAGLVGVSVRRASDTEFVLEFPQQTAYGTYHVYVGPNLESVRGMLLDQDRDGILGEATDDRYDAAFTLLDATGPRITGATPRLPLRGPLDHLDVTFSEAIDAASFTLADVTAAGPAGLLTPTRLDQLDPRTFRLVFPAQSAEGLYRFTFGPGVQDLVGNWMDQDQDGQKAEPHDQYPATVAIDLTGPRATGHSLAGVQHVAVRSFEVTFNEDLAAATFTPNLVTVTGPEGSRQATLITALAGNRFCVTIPPTAADGTYHVSLAPALTDVAGNLLDQDADRIGGEIPDDRYAFDFEQQLADLVVTGSVVPLEAQPGQPIDIQWTVTNLGRGAATGTWTDLLFLSADGQPGNDVELARLSFSQLLGPGESYVRIATVNVPADVRGDQWVVIQTNGLSELDETETGNNGRVASPPLYVTTRPYPDLRVTSVQTPVTLSAGESAAITWTVLNGGRGATTSPRWFDAIYLSADAVFDAADTKLAEVPNPDFLGSGESYSQTVQIPIPNTTPHGDYYVLVVTDARNQVQEFDGEQNNAAASATTAAVIAPLPAFLTVTNILVSGPLAPGGEPTFTWTVTNTGGTTITTGWNFDRSWDDGLALSRDPVYQADQDYWLGSHTFFWDLPLRPGQSYTLTGATEQAVPAWEPGDYYLMVLPDTHWGADAGFGQSTVGRSYGTALVRLEYALPDLVPASLDVPATGLVGQPLTVGWRIENRGTGDTWGVTWNDHVYLSADNVLDEHDRLLGFRPNPGLVYAGGSYDVSTAWTLPGDLLPGSYYVLLKTDVGETVPESDETNNLRVSAAPVTVQRSVSDLQVTAAQGPAAGVAGETIAVAWSVLNGGLDATAVGQWTDAVYLSPSPALDPATATCLQEFAHTGGLAAQGTYDRSETVTLPSRIAGTSYLFVVLDARQELFELGGENNNVQPLGPSIAVADLAPDLAAESFTAPANAVAGQTLDLNWSVRNVGTRDAAPNWWDAVYLSSDDTWDPQCDTLLGKVERTAALAVGDPYGPAGGGVQVTVPDRIDGTYFLFLVTDVDRQLYEQGRLANNIARQSVAIVDQAPDLRVQSVTTPAGGVAGEVINLSYRVSNGGTEVATERWKDAVYLSADTQFDPAADKLFGAFDAAGPLAVGDAYGPNAAGPVRARLPERLEGTYYIFLVTDYRDAVYEHFGEANNFLLSPTPIHISLQAPDLQVTLVRAPLQARAGETLTVDWAVVNGGLQATAETHWQDGVYLSTDTDFTPAADLELGLADHDGTLAAGAGYTSRATFTLRQDLEGPYYVYVVTDARRQVFEHLAEDNNTLAARQTVAVAGVHADLQVSELQAPPTGVAGGSLRLAWKVINAGRDATPAGSWSDAVYLSADAVLDDGDRELASFRHDRPVAAGGFYWQDETVGLPDGLTGSFYLIVKTDTGRGGGEVDEFQAEDNNTAAAPIACSLPPPVDLRVTEVRPAATAWSGQDVQVGWTVANLGGAAAESPAGGWYDSVFLSRDPYLDRDTDLRLGSFLVPGSLAASGDSYAPAITARLPAGISGPYYVLVWTDSNDRVAERGGEDNNVWASVTPLQVNLTPPADLQVTQVAPPATGTLGQPAEWQYRVANLATDEAAYGAWYDTLYLSADEQWDLGDPRIARVYHQGDVPAAGFYEQTVTANVPGVQPGDYYVIVRTDILNDVREQDELQRGA
ncbi:MAG: hypothetical protein NTY19_32405, partial [Planctomycetota bacterium]|nr:hypothetical protein [Planctomycetota bacterium]